MGTKKILVVDDDKSILHIIEARLRHAGYDVELASSGEEALTCMRKKLPRLVLLDIVMPGIDGFTVLETIKGDRRLKKAPVIMITSKAEDRDVQRAITMGAKDYLVKPFSPGVLLDKVRRETGAK